MAALNEAVELCGVGFGVEGSGVDEDAGVAGLDGGDVGKGFVEGDAVGDFFDLVELLTSCLSFSSSLDIILTKRREIKSMRKTTMATVN